MIYKTSFKVYRIVKEIFIKSFVYEGYINIVSKDNLLKNHNWNNTGVFITSIYIV